MNNGSDAVVTNESSRVMFLSNETMRAEQSNRHKYQSISCRDSCSLKGSHRGPWYDSVVWRQGFMPVGLGDRPDLRIVQYDYTKGEEAAKHEKEWQ